MKKDNLTTKVISLSCENKPGVLGKIIATLTRPGHEIVTLSQSKTDLSEYTLLTIEVRIPAARIDHMLCQIRRIMEVFEVSVSFGSVLRSAIYRLTTSACTSQTWAVLNRYNARALELNQDHLLIHYIGTETEVLNLHNALDSPALVAFSQLPLAISQPLTWEEVVQSLV